MSSETGVVAATRCSSASETTSTSWRVQFRSFGRAARGSSGVARQLSASAERPTGVATSCRFSIQRSSVKRSSVVARQYWLRSGPRMRRTVVSRLGKSIPP